MQKYERVIGLKTIYMTLLRRTEAILALFFAFALASFIVTNFFIPKEYTSTATFATNDYSAAITSANYPGLQSELKSDLVLEAVVNNLKTGKVTHANGNNVTKSEVSSGLSFAPTSASSAISKFTVTFKSDEPGLTKYVLSEYCAVAKDYLGNHATAAFKKVVPGEASEATKTSKENTYLLIGVAASLVVALAVPFIYEIVTDQVYQKSDIEDFGAEAFEIRASGK